MLVVRLRNWAWSDKAGSLQNVGRLVEICMPEDLARWFLLIAMPLGTAGLSSCADRSPHGFNGLDDVLSQLRSEGVPPPVDDQTTYESSHNQDVELQREGPISLSDLLLMAKTRNPQLAAARSDIGINAGQAWQASLYPNPRLELSSEEVPFDSGVDDGITVISVSQPIVIGDRLHAAVDAADAQKSASRARLELAVRETFGEIAQLHAQLLAIRQADALYAELAELGGQTLSIATTRFEARAATESEVIRPQIELRQIELARARLMKEQQAAAEQLSLLIGGAPVDIERLSGEITDQFDDLDLQELSRLTRAEHPSLLVADREVDAAAAQVKRIRAERVPDLEVRAGVGYEGDADEEIYEIGIGAAVPLWDNRDGDVLSARFALMRARQERLVVENNLIKRLIAAHAEYESARAQLEIVTSQIVPAAKRSFEQTQEAYRGGHAAFLELLDSQRTLTEARTTFIELCGQAAIARARIMQIVGRLKPEGQSPFTITTDAPNGAEVSQ